MYQVSFDSDLQKLRKKQVRLEFLPQKFFLVNGKQFKSNSDGSGKILRKNTCSKKKQIIVIQPEKFNELQTGSVLQNGVQENIW